MTTGAGRRSRHGIRSGAREALRLATAAHQATRLIGEAGEIGLRDSAGSKTLPSKKVSLPRDVDVRDVRRGDAERLGRLAPQFLAIDLIDQRLDVGRRRELAPAHVLGEEPDLVALERIGRVVAPELHQAWCLRDAAVAVVDVALEAADDVGRGTLNHWRLPTMSAISSLFSILSHHCCASMHAISSALAAFGFLSTQSARMRESLFRMFCPDLAGGAGRVADALVDELLVPRLADAEGVHVADLHVGHHLRRRHDDGRDVLVGIDAAGGQPVADPQIVGAAREGHGDLDFACPRPSLRRRRP